MRLICVLDGARNGMNLACVSWTSDGSFLVAGDQGILCVGSPAVFYYCCLTREQLFYDQLQDKA